MLALWGPGSSFTNPQTLWDTEASVSPEDHSSSYSELQLVIITNSPQLGVTMIYYIYNKVLTNMLLCAEYSSYGIDRKFLRVTWPVKGSQQRSTYWLSIPYRYGIPVLVLFTAVHWLVSQGSFYVLVIPYDGHGQLMFEKKYETGTATGLPLLCACGALLVLGVLIFGLSFQKLKSSVPLAGPCSAAISAACHPTGEVCTATAAHCKLMWGEVDMPTGWVTDEDDRPRKGHCSFTPLKAQKPSLDKIYA
ncbi:hypothetical protein BDV24DRAFT_153937 [Aspergillus arachidicola]|uniref:Uncharacterized protein n=1 Tax=Aspergillus arachidicola TaxID=656916 RepID=A0A5N6XXN3_9EURO|nr:hypothetical protein BDV24DRAFT_153937 [Aspergillus arachidicola]